MSAVNPAPCSRRAPGGGAIRHPDVIMNKIPRYPKLRRRAIKSSDFRQNNVNHVYWMPTQEHYFNCYSLSGDAGSYQPPQQQPRKHSLLKMPRMVFIFPVYGGGWSENDDGEFSGSRGHTLKTQMESLKTDLESNYKNLYLPIGDVRAPYYETTPPDPNNLIITHDWTPFVPWTTGRWLQYLLPRKADVESSDKYLGGDVLNIVIYNDLGFDTSGFLLGGWGSNGWGYPNWPNSVAFFDPTGDDIATRTEVQDFKIANLAEDINIVKSAYPYFGRFKTLLLYDSDLPQYNERGTVFQVVEEEYDPTEHCDPDGTYLDADHIKRTFYRTNNVDDVPTGSECQNGSRSVWQVWDDINIWNDSAVYQPQHLQNIANSLSSHGFEFKGSVSGKNCKDTLKALIKAHFRLP